MRIVELSTGHLPSPPTRGGAIERYVYQLSKAIALLGEEVHLISINSTYSTTRNSNMYIHTYPDENPSTPERLLGILISKLSSPPNRKLPYTTRAVFTILMRIEEMFGSIDVIHNHFFTTAFAPIVFKSFKPGTLLIQHYHNAPTPKIINKSIAKCYDIHLAVSDYIRSGLIRSLRIPQNKAFTVYNGIDVDEFVCDNGYRETWEMYGIGSHETVILYIRRITIEKGSHYPIEAHVLARRLNDLKLRPATASPIEHLAVPASQVGELL